MYSIDVCIFEAIYGRFVDEYNGKYVNMFAPESNGRSLSR